MGSVCARFARQELRSEGGEMQSDRLKHEQEMRKLEDENRRLSEVNLTLLSKQREQRIRDEIGQNYQQIFPEQSALSEKIIRCRTKILNLRPGRSVCISKNLPVPDRLFISLFGETGTGKTSLINSLICAVEGVLSEESRLQTGHDNFQGAHTMGRLTVSLTEHLSVVDNRGINTEIASDSGVQMEVIKHLEGRYQRGEVEWTSQTTAEGIAKGQKSYCTVLVVSADHSDVLPQYKSFIDCLRRWQGLFPIAVVTKCDEDSSEEVRRVLNTLGIGEIYDVVNITSEKPDLSAESRYSLLKLLERCFIDGDSVFVHRQRLLE